MVKILKKIKTGEKYLLKSVKHLLPLTWLKKLTPRQRLFFWAGVGALLIFVVPLIVAELFFPKGSKAAWFDENYLYRQVANISNPNATLLSDFQVALTVNTASLISAGKMQANCNDIRITDQDGNLLPFWVEEGSADCNSTATKIWTRVPSIATSGASVFFYYGNQQPVASQSSGITTFELFDDFRGSQLDSTKWSESTIGATSGTAFSVGNGVLSGGNSNRYIRSINTYTGNYVAETRVKTISSPVNGYTTIGFYNSLSDNFGILDHNGTSYYRTDSTWVNFGYSGTGQWNHDSAKVVGTTGTYSRVGETSGLATGTSVNSGLSSEQIRISARYDDSAYDQNFSATWDWIFVRKGASTDPTVSFGSEENSPSPVAYWALDEGTGNVASSSASVPLPGQIFGATWTPDSQCVAGKCLMFDGTDDYLGNSSSAPTTSVSTWSIEAWIKPSNLSQLSLALYNGNDSGGYGFGIGNGAGSSGSKLQGLFGNVVWIDSGYTFPSSNQWYHVAMTRDGTTTRFYVNGIQTSSTSSSTPGAVASRFSVGMQYSNANAATRFFNGFIDEPKMFNYQRTAGQIKADFNARGGLNAGSNVLGATQNNVLSNGLVGYWKMDEASWNGTSGEVVDSSGNGNNGTSVLGAEATPSAKFGNAGYFAGNDEYVSVADAATLDPGTGDWTVASWIRNNGAKASPGIVAKNAGNAGWRFYQNGTSEITLGIYNGSVWSEYTSSGGGIANNVWYHVAATVKRNGNVTLFVNGVPITSTSLSATVGVDVSNTSPLLLADDNYCRASYCGQFPGNLDEVRYYNRALNPMEVAQLYNFAPGPVGYWNFEEGQGSVVNDSSTYGNNGTWVGTGSKWGVGKYGKGGSFDGSSNYVSAPYNSAFKFATGDFTISWWANHSRLSGLDTYYEDGFYYAGFLIRHQGEMGVYIQYASGADYYGFPWVPTLGKWNYLTLRRQEGNLNFYVDGVQVSTTRTSLQNIQPSTPTFIGHSTHAGETQFFNGKLDEFRVYNYARTLAQIISDMNAGAPSGASVGRSAVAYWDFDEGYGTTVNNSGNQGASLVGVMSGFASPAISTSGWTNDGKIRKALSFDGTDDKVTTAGVDLTSGDWTMSAWVKPSAYGAQWRRVFESGAVGGYGFGFASGLLEVTVTSVGDATASTITPELNQWSHIVATFIDVTNSLTYYVNGVKANTVTFNTSPTAGVKTRYLGGFYTGAYYAGFIDEAKIYNYALTAQDVKADYNKGSSLVLGAGGTDSSGNASNSASTYYCVPGSSDTCRSPVGEWNFEEGAASTVNDTSGNGKTGTWQGTLGSQWTQGKVGKAGKFNGSDNYVSAATIPAASVTAQAWVYSSNYATNMFVVQKAPVNAEWELFFESGQLLWRGGSTTSILCTAPANNQWHFVAGTQTGTTATLYIDGKQCATGTVTAMPNGSGLMDIGRLSGGGYFFNGKIDQVKVYDYVRTLAQIAYDYNQGKPVVYYDFDECQGPTINEYYNSGVNGTIQIGSSGTQTTVGTCQNSNSAAAWYNGRSGKWNSSLNLDGTDDFVDLGNPSILPDSTSGRTLCGWGKPSATSGNGWIMSYGSTGTGQAFFIGQIGTTLWAGGYNGDDVTSSDFWSAGSWGHACLTYDGTTARLYGNGKLRTSLAKSWTLVRSKAFIGKQVNNAEFWAGSVDDLMIFNYPLTAVQVRGVYNQGSAVRFGPLTGSP